MNIGILQFDIIWENKDANKKKIKEYLDAALTNSDKKIDWLILPEYSLTGFSFDKNKTELTQSDYDFFAELAQKYSVYISYSGIINNANNLITINANGNVISNYSKIHLFSYAGEDKIYNAGAQPEIFEIENFKILPAICYDLRFSYLFWDNAENTDIILIAANWPDIRSHHWKILAQSRAIENQCFVCAVNRIGADPKNKYCGDSMIIAPNGDIILNSENADGLFTATINKNDIIFTREKFPVLKDRKKIKYK
ncbi:MAG TPA: nitrilase-related carbon-nitrogen hydrolase [bacterium]|nr:nitrilase-related carbon-nitrogen hydrolase [bacterium]HPP87286.1 nitrilase-related carbon-nitrogen hydrolase [bacterium]